MSWGSWSAWATACPVPKAKSFMCHQPTPPTCQPKPVCRPPSHKLNLKALVVVAEDTMQKMGELVIPAPIGVSCDPVTGRISHNVRLEPVGEPVLRPILIKDKVVNEGFVNARLIVENNDPQPCPDVRKTNSSLVVIPFQSIHDIQGICPSDHVQEFAEIEALLVSCTPAPCPTGQTGNLMQLHLKAILNVHIVVARECIVVVSGDLLHCLPPLSC